MSTIDRKSIPELMDGRYFYIPDYQRGYRWAPEQVEALLKDLFVYAKGTSHSSSTVDDSDYYCLQPIVAREISNPVEKNELKIPVSEKAWEIVDGQQRLTTVYILYLYLMQHVTITPGTPTPKTLYQVIYATRKGSTGFLKSLGNPSTVPPDSNIDYYHMSMAYDTIDQWIQSSRNPGSDVCSLCARYSINTGQPSAIIRILWQLLNAVKGVPAPIGTVQFLWYELDPDKNVIQEFRENNANQVKLTDAELIKALFLRKINGSLPQELMERSNQWESVENTLQINSFWCFLNKKGQDMPSRINLLFRLRYQLEELDKKPKDIPEDDWLKECEKNLEKKNFLFNYFNDKFDGLSPTDLPTKTAEEWQAIMTIFHTLEDWYDDAICYNLIGMLSQFENSQLAKYYYAFDHMDENQSREEFKQYLKSCIREQFQDLKYDKSGKLTLNYKSRKVVFNLLLLLNIHHLNNQAEGVKSIIQNGTTYKFPFAVLNKAWNIEHIDSFTTKNLEDPKDMCDWIDVALTDLQIDETERAEVVRLRNDGKKKALKMAIEKLKKIAKEEELSEDQKNNISNLTLLDEETNKSYGNALFVTKRKEIINRMKSGTYVPITTYYVFMKLFDEKGTSPRTEWSKDDMAQYHDYICDQLQNYLPSKTSEQ